MGITSKSFAWIVLSLAGGIVAAIGCSPQAENQQSGNENANVTETSVASESTSGCCGKCSSEQQGQTAAGQAAGCCGKCGGAAESTNVTTNVKPKGTCENCEGQHAAVSNESGKTATCENGCNACAEGNSANCKCGAAGASPAKSDGPPKAHVNSMPEDRDIFHYLLEHHGKITRTVTELENGVKTLTESTDPIVAKKLQEHVASMYQRVEDGRPLRMWDEMYREIFQHTDKIKMELENTDGGISVIETSDDEYVVKLIKAHAKVVSGFAERGFNEARLNHEPPKK